MHDLESLASGMERGDLVAVFSRDGRNFLAAESHLATSEHFLLRPGDVHDLARSEFALCSRDTDGEKTPALFPQHGNGTRVNVDCAARPLKIREPSLLRF